MSDTRRPEARPWHDAAPPAVIALGHRAALRGASAGIVSRVLANGIDGVVVVLLVVAGYLAVVGVRFVLSPITFALPVPSSAGAVAVLLAAQVLYFALAWAALGATYGDRVLGLAVTDDRGRRLRWGRSVVRAVLCTAFPLGLAWVLVSRRNRSVQDLLLRSAVVYT
ncbi:RDD family protein [Amnibacterium sp.]|uniref:RDD family protein n=1 Tax=Amnibacterium sp. TaxID=1872496 RepID=UPI003F7C1C8C